MNDSASSVESAAPAKRTRRKLKLLGVLRVMAYAFVVCLVMSALAARSAWGDLKESALVLGRELVTFGDLLGKSHRLRLNGEPVFVASAMTDQTVQQVIDRFDKTCREHAGGLVEEFENLPEAVRAKVPERYQGSEGVGILRKDGDQEGVIACLSQDGKEGSRGVLRNFDAFAATGDLASIGKLRYVYATRTAAGKTHVVVVWTDGSFKIRNIVPMDGAEPPGSDPPDTPRPMGATRLLSAEVEGAPYGVHIYDVPRKSEEVLRGYEEEMPKHGWTALPVVAAKQSDARAFQRPGSDILVIAHPKGDRTYVSLVETVSR
ncbi:MAG: hypothetical protein HY898_33930 [Deltaproteobacteria bacterium]|nr:hypothetical protein [Deltaproteobacteria bacterium]